MPNLNITVPRVRVNISGVPAWLDDIISDKMEAPVRDAFNSSFASTIPNLIKSELHNMLDVELPNLVPGTSLSTNLNTSAIHIDESGIDIKTDIHFNPPFSFEEKELVVFAPVAKDSDAAEFPKNSDVELNISLDIINQFLTNLWSQEKFTFEIDEKALETIQNTVPIGLQNFNITSTMPPRVEMKEGQLVLTNADLIVNALLGEDISLSAATTTAIGLMVEVSENRGLRLVKGDQDTFATVIEGLDAGLTEGLLATILDISANFFIAQINSLLEDVKLPGDSRLADVLEIEAQDQRIVLKGNL